MNSFQTTNVPTQPIPQRQVINNPTPLSSIYQLNNCNTLPLSSHVTQTMHQIDSNHPYDSNVNNQSILNSNYIHVNNTLAIPIAPRPQNLMSYIGNNMTLNH